MRRTSAWRSRKDKQPTYAFTDLFTNGRPPVDDLFEPTPVCRRIRRPMRALAPRRTRRSCRSPATPSMPYEISKMWHLDLGIRWDRVDIDYSSVATTGVETLFGRLDTAVTGRAGVVFKPRPRAAFMRRSARRLRPAMTARTALSSPRPARTARRCRRNAAAISRSGRSGKSIRS